MQEPLHDSLKTIHNIPYTISYVLRKKQQVESYNELPKEKRPPEKLAWDGTVEEIENWFDRVFPKDKKQNSNELIIMENEIEG